MEKETAGEAIAGGNSHRRDGTVRGILAAMSSFFAFLHHIAASALFVAALSLLPAAGNALAQAGYPEQTVRILVGFSPGVAPDVTARLLADKLAAAWSKPVVVENVTGAGGNIAVGRVAKAPPDGYTLGMNGNGSLVFSPSMYDKLSFDPVRDFAPISQIFVGANVLVVPNEVPARTLPELVALARARPGALTYAHAGAGTSQHLAAELFKSMAHLDIQPVAYRGTTALLPDLLAGRVTLSFGNIVNVLPLVREGKLRAFAVTSIRRSATAPDLPTMAESGFPNSGDARRAQEAQRPRPGRDRRLARGARGRHRARDPAMGQGDQAGRDQGERVARSTGGKVETWTCPTPVSAAT